MRLGPLITVALLATVGATGCESAHIKDAYVSLDSDGRRLPKDDCIRPTKLDGTTPNHYFVFVEMLSFRDDTILTPVLKNVNDGRYMAWAESKPGNDEILEFGNIAPGKGDHVISWEQVGPPVGDNDNGPLPEGLYTWEFYLDDHGSADAVIDFAVAAGCK
ncbi:MAG: hypothetical protein IT375_20375 [Polyangiaceae bacterium]|nr:hypothetical protein [Polyangiaceae bacterium]